MREWLSTPATLTTQMFLSKALQVKMYNKKHLITVRVAQGKDSHQRKRRLAEPMYAHFVSLFLCLTG